MRYVVLFVVAASLLGCSTTLPGWNDVALEYTGVEVSATRARLGAAQVPADVELIDSSRVRVTVNAKSVASAKRWLAWRRVVAVRRGAEELAQIKPKRAVAGDKRLVVLAADAPALQALVAQAGEDPVTLSVAGRDVWTGTLRHVVAQPILTVPVGDDVRAYGRARSLARLLDSPTPKLIGEPAEQPVSNAPLALATLVLPIAVGLVWLAFVRFFDRKRPEPWWLVLVTFGLGAVAQLVAGPIELFAIDSTPYLDPDAMALDGSVLAFFVCFVVTALVVGVVEEGFKLLAAWSVAMHRREFDEPVDGIVYGAAAGIGFATMEGIKYFARYRLHDDVVVMRSVETFIGHAMYASLWGYALGRRLVAKKGRVWTWFALAVALHTLWDTALHFYVRFSTLVLNVVITTLFVIVLRRALRWGSTDQLRDEAPPSADRTHFRVGSPVRCGVAVAAMYVFGGLLMFVWYDEIYGKRGILWTAPGAYVLVALFAGAAWAVARALPLDVAVDALGVTFAGELWRWSDIESVTRLHHRTLVMTTATGRVTLGPALPQTIDLLESAIRARQST